MFDDDLPESEPCPGAIDHAARVLAGWLTRSNYERWGALPAAGKGNDMPWAGERRIVRAMPTPTRDEEDDEARPVQGWADMRQRLEAQG